MSPPNEAETAKHDTVYLSFEAPSIHASESKASKVDEGAPVIQEPAMEATSSAEEKPNEEAAPIMDEVPPATVEGETKPDSSSLIDEWESLGLSFLLSLLITIVSFYVLSFKV